MTAFYWHIVHKIFPLIVIVLSILFVTCDNTKSMTNAVFNLEKVFSTQNVQLEAIKTRDNKRVSLKGMSTALVNFSVAGAYDLTLAGIYYTKIKLGTPPREFNVIIDTGSDDLWITCSPCVGCPRSSHLGVSGSLVELHQFDHANSNSASLLNCSNKICRNVGVCLTNASPCEFMEGYADGSVATGYYLSDILHLDTIVGPSTTVNSNVIFGCGTNVGGLLSNEYRALDGIFGFGHNYQSVITQLSSKRIIPKILSHCLKEDGGGILVIGEILELGMVYTPLVPTKGQYNLYLDSITLNGQLLPVNPQAYNTSGSRGIIVDSGTTLLYLVSDLYDAFISGVNIAVSPYCMPVVLRGNQCYQLSNSEITIFPSIAFHFNGGASMRLTPKDYLLNSPDLKNVMCMGIQRSLDSFPDLSILGDLALKNKIVVYDMVHFRVGWVNYDCSMPMHVLTPSYWNMGKRKNNKAKKVTDFVLKGIKTKEVHDFVLTGVNETAEKEMNKITEEVIN
ncbi:aspartic proteinase 36-like [Impatiens glandulifera]|uniref:aspartic proteinase 36-like n=1 Tax=Impatiens glandulifera TaxID=253017 RepID=UPI001FB14D6D|nr:aspartic proteinase 36-like [Impatiens glandulifera]